MCLFVFPVNVGEDCPVFDGMYEFCQLSAGGSIGMFTSLIRNISVKTCLNNKYKCTTLLTIII